jgi:hypothetical protein
VIFIFLSIYYYFNSVTNIKQPSSKKSTTSTTKDIKYNTPRRFLPDSVVCYEFPPPINPSFIKKNTSCTTNASQQWLESSSVDPANLRLSSQLSFQRVTQKIMKDGAFCVSLARTLATRINTLMHLSVVVLRVHSLLTDFVNKMVSLEGNNQSLPFINIRPGLFYSQMIDNTLSYLLHIGW